MQECILQMDILHFTTVLISAYWEEASMILAKGPDLYRLGYDYEYTPRKDSATSLAMYSSWAFADWRRGLVANEVDLEKFID